MAKDLSCIILAAGKGTRMNSDRPKVMAPLAGMPLIRHVIKACEGLAPAQIITVIAPKMDDVAAAVAPHATAIQKQQRGTGDAVKSAIPVLIGGSGKLKGYVLIALGDVPMVTTTTLKALVAAGKKNGLSVLAFRASDPTGYGRLITDKSNFVTQIVEQKDANPAQQKINLVNGGLFCVDARKLGPWLDGLTTNNSQREYYLTDIITLAAKDKMKCAVVEAPENELQGINSRMQLAEAEDSLQITLRMRALENGVTLIDPASVFFAADTVLGRDVIIEPNVFFGAGVTIADNVTIHAFSHLEGASIGDGASIGPFARIRPKSKIGAKATIGNFVEVNRATVKAGAKSKHVSYLGDAVIGEKSNIGAGTVIANYDGFDKQDTRIGKGVFIGSNSTLVAPLNVGDGAYVAAGSALTTDVPSDALAIARARSVVRADWANEYRSKKSLTPTIDKNARGVGGAAARKPKKDKKK